MIKMDNKIVDILDWQVTSECMLNCLFCYGSPKTIRGPTKEEVRKVIEELSKANVKYVVLSGGEPLLREDIKEIIKSLYDLNVKIFLSTNAMLIMDKIHEIKSYLSWIGVPLDGSTPEILQRQGKGAEQLNKVLSFLDYTKNNFKVKIKVGTVVNKLNKKDIQNIGRLLEEYPHINTWRLYNFYPIRRGLKYANTLHLSDDEFKNIVSGMIKKFPSINISSLTNGEREGSCVMIEPNLQLTIQDGKNYLNLGDLHKNNLLDILSNKSINNQKIYHRSRYFLD